MATPVLPDDIIFQILIWLPVQSLLRFKSVCTSWYALIQSSHFIQSHATTTTADDNNSKVGGTFMTFQSIVIPELHLLSDKGFAKVDISLWTKDIGPQGTALMAGSVHGIICMYNRYTSNVVLWNPSTKQCRLLPESLNLITKGWYRLDCDFVGFCFDDEIKDYKVIRVSSYESKYEKGPIPGRNLLRKVQIYCLSNDSWRLVYSDFHSHRHCCAYSVAGQSLNGIYFHQGVGCTAGEKHAILSFDLRKEKYQRVVEIPEQDNWFELELIDDKLACITHPLDPYILIYKVWKLNDYGTAKESWTELYRVNFMTPEIETRYGRCFGGILATSWNGEFGLLRCHSLLRYNSITNEIEDLGFGKGINLFVLRAAIYKESLVPSMQVVQQLKLSPPKSKSSAF